MIQIALCIKEEPDWTRLSGMLRRRLMILGVDAILSPFYTTASFEEACSRAEFSLLFIDTDFSGCRGLACAAKLRKNGVLSPIVFLSPTQKLALDCFSVHPAGYYIKPLLYDQLCALLDWHKSLLVGSCRSISVVCQRIPRTVYQHDIFRITVAGRTATLHTPDGDLQTNRSLNDLAAVLDPAVFVRCSRSTMVNLDHIAAMNGPQLLLENGESIPAATERLDELQSLLEKRSLALSALFRLE